MINQFKPNKISIHQTIFRKNKKSVYCLIVRQKGRISDGKGMQFKAYGTKNKIGKLFQQVISQLHLPADTPDWKLLEKQGGYLTWNFK